MYSSSEVYDTKENQQNSKEMTETSCESGPKCLSPIFRAIPPTKVVRCLPSPDEDIPSYQIPRGSKRFSSTSEEQESVLPISPVVTPPSVTKKDFQPPLVPTIGTIVKKKSAKRTSSETIDKLQPENVAHNYFNAFDELGMTEKDISWDSSMETPAAKPLTLDAFNTIERATFLPASDLKNMQPRALFSPEKNSELDCLPLKYSSESEEEKDGCSKKIEDKSIVFVQVLEDNTSVVKVCEKKGHSQNTRQTKDYNGKNEPVSPRSPVFNVKSFKRKSKTKKLRPLLVKSPVIVTKNDKSVEGEEIACDLDFCMDDTLAEVERNNTKHSELVSEQLNSIQDDSFQNMSFSYIDELIKTSVSESDCNLSRSIDCSSVLSKPATSQIDGRGNYNTESLSLTEDNIPKHYYESTQSCKLYPMSSVNGFLKDAMILEEVEPLEKKSHADVPNTRLTVFNEMINDISDTELSKQCVNQAKYKCSKEKSPLTPHKNKMMKFNIKEESKILARDATILMTGGHRDLISDISSHFDDNDTQMCLTAAYAESFIINNPQSIKGGNSIGSLKEDSEKKRLHTSCEKAIDEAQDNEPHIKKKERNTSQSFPMFTTALGKSISVSNDALEKVQHLLDEHKQSDSVKFEFTGEDGGTKDSGVGFQGFKTASGAAVKISEKSLNKVKSLFRDLEVMDESAGPSVTQDVKSCTGFSTASGTELKISEESIRKAEMALVRMGEAINDEEIMDECEKHEDNPGHVGFMTASNKPVEISNEALRKAKSIWKGEEVIGMDNFSEAEEATGANFRDKRPGAAHKNRIHLDSEESKSTIANDQGEACVLVKCEQSFCGFSTASGKNITVSEKALTKVRKILREEEERSESCGPKSGEKERLNEVSIDVQCKRTSPKPTSECDSALVDVTSAESSLLIPSWLHTYNTSPTLTMDRMHLEAVTSHEDFHQHSTCREQYLIRSPILGATDRFYDRRERRNRGRKLIFETSPKRVKSQESAENPNVTAPYKMGVRNAAVKRDMLELNIDFTVPFKRRKVEEPATTDVSVEDTGKLTEDLIEGRRKARLEQTKAGRKGKEQPTKGSHFLKKQKPQTSWFEAVRGGFPERYTEDTLHKHGVRDDVMHITVHNALDYRFRCLDFYASAHCFTNTNGFPVGDGCSLIFDDDNTAGVDEMARAFLASPGVDPSLISEKWVKNHYKWIVWKFSHYERSFPHIFGGRCLTPHNVMVQLKYRYDREIDCSQRSALKKILERDEPSTRKMVLCVCDIDKTVNLDTGPVDSSINKNIVSYKLGLTDGWYSCYADTDFAMTRLVEDGKVVIGTKLITQGAELLNCDKGVSPLKADENVRLKISTNSTRRVRWDTKLGFRRNGGPLLVSLSSILPNGGLVGRIDVIIVRIYPILYMEKKSDGSHVIRNTRAEDRAMAAYQQQQEATIEKIYQQAKCEMESKLKVKEKQGIKLSVSNVSKVTDAEELYRLYENCSDPSTFQNVLTPEQRDILSDYQRQKNENTSKELSEIVREKIKTEKMNCRKVTPMLRVKIVDLHKADYANPVQFTVWNSTEDVSQMLSEGKAISIFNSASSNSRFLKVVQLNSTRQTQYKELRKNVEYPARKLTRLDEFTPEYEPMYNEVDFVGIVVKIHDTYYGSRLSQTVFMTDVDFNYVGVVFWGNCKEFGWEAILTVNAVVACSNLQWHKKRNFRNIPSVYMNDSSVFTENPRQAYLREEIQRLKTSLPQDQKSFIRKCEEGITIKLNEEKHSSSAGSRNTSIPNDSNLSVGERVNGKSVNGFKMTPNASSTPCKSVAFALDTSGQEPSPIQRRIEKLQVYGEPPPLSPLLPLGNLIKFKTKFKVPFKTSPSGDTSAA